MTEEYWANSQFLIARYYGGIQIGGKSYKIVNKQGATIFELSDPDSPYYVGDGVKKAIEPGEPADLVLEEWIPTYKKLGRERTIECVKQGISVHEARKLCTKVRSNVHKTAKSRTQNGKRQITGVRTKAFRARKSL